MSNNDFCFFTILYSNSSVKLHNISFLYGCNLRTLIAATVTWFCVCWRLVWESRSCSKASYRRRVNSEWSLKNLKWSHGRRRCNHVMAVWLNQPCRRYNVFTPCMFLLERIRPPSNFSRLIERDLRTFVVHKLRKVYCSCATGAWCYQRRTAPHRRLAAATEWVPGGRCRCLSLSK